MKPLKAALEDEQGLHFPDGNIANVADKFLNHQLNLDSNGNTKYFHREGTLHQIEFNSQPYSSLDDLCGNFLEAEEIRQKICKDRRVISIPISETGAGVGKRNPAVINRLHGYRVIFGEEALDGLLKNSGIHIHVDAYKPRLVDQFNSLTALRPTISLISTSSVSHEGENSLNCHRYHIIADPDEGALAAIHEERGYIDSIQDLAERDQRRSETWKREFDANIWSVKDLPLDYNFLKEFPIEKTGYADVRNRPNMGDGTLEFRSNDTAPADIKIGYLGLVLGYSNMILQEEGPIPRASQDDIYSFEKGKVIFPNEATLERYTKAATKKGLEAEAINQYDRQILQFAEQGLPESERHYLDPLKEMLDSGKNIASQILDHLGHKSHYNPAEAARANLFVWERDQQGIENLKAKLGYKG